MNEGDKDIALLDDINSPAVVRKVLEKGPKFASETKSRPPELLSLVRNVAAMGEEVDRETCILEGVEVLPGGPGGTSARSNVVKVIS